MTEKLLNVREVCQYLGLSEAKLRNLVDAGKIPAYRLGGAILRFRKDQIDKIKTQGIPKVPVVKHDDVNIGGYSRMDKFKDFLYFNDFYIISAIVAVVLLTIIFLY